MSTVPLLVAAAGMDRSDSTKYVGSRAPKVAASTLASHNDAFARVLQFKLRAFLKGTNTKERTFTSDFLVYLRWDSGNEPKPEADPNQWDRVDAHGEVTQAGLKRPEIQLYGAESEVPLIMATYYNEHTAHFFGKYNWLVTFSANMDMRLFPFETLALSHTIQMAARLEPWEGEFNVANCPTPAVSNLLIKTSDTWSPVACKVSSEYTKSRMSIVRMELSVERNPSFFLTNILPINYILALSGVCVNAIDHREVGERMGIVFTLLLTTVAYKLLILDLVPQLPYSTVLDYLVLFGILANVLQLAEVFYVGKTGESALSDETALSLDTAYFWVHVIAVTAAHAIVILAYKVGFFRRYRPLKPETKLLSGGEFVGDFYRPEPRSRSAEVGPGSRVEPLAA